jgi:Concanavalin A-like lectin/glucanases superfamily
MSLRSVGNQLLQTVPSAVLAGASTASLSLWVRVNTGSNVSNSNGVEIFGDTGGKFSATLSGSGNLLIRWSSTNGATGGSSSYGLTLIPGTNYHIAAVWQNGAQTYYLNGVLVHSDTQVGTIGVVGDSSTHSYRLGSDSAGTDVTLDEPTLWIGYALRSQDVTNLRNRSITPQGIASSSIALAWSLAGANGVAAQIGDAGLADSSTTGLNLSSIVGAAPTYQAGVLSYYLPVTASITPSGEAIAVLFQDGAGNPTNLSAIASSNDVQAISLLGNPAGSAFTLTFNGQKTAAIPVTNSPPASYGLWTVSTVVGHSYSLGATWPSKGPNGALVQVFETLDGSGNSIATSSQTMRSLPSNLTDNQHTLNGSTIYWNTISTFTATTTTYSVRVTASTDGQWYIDGLRVQDTTANTITYQDDQSGSLTAVPSVSQLYSSQGDTYLGTLTAINPTGTGHIYRSSASTIQSALLALSSVQAGGLTVAASDGASDGPYTVQFGGPMGGAAQPLLTAGDPNVSIAHTIVGGNFPTYSLNGGALVTLPNSPVWSPQNSFALYNLFQSAPAVQYSFCGDGHCSESVFQVANGTGSLSGQPITVNCGSASGSAVFTFSALTAGTYQFAATWQATGLLSTNAVFQIEDGSNTVLSSTTVNQSIAPTDITDGGFGYKIIGSVTIAPNSTNSQLKLVLTTTGSTGILAIDGVRLALTSANLSVTIQPSDSLVFHVPANWATTTIGPVAAASITATNLVGGTMLPPISGPYTMGVGYNCEGDPNSGTFFFYSNLARRVATTFDALLGKVVSSDANGYPLKINTQYLQFVSIAGFANAQGELGKGLNSLPNGYYTLMWDWDGNRPASTLFLAADGNFTSTEVTRYQNITGTTNNVRVFNLQATSLQFSPLVQLTIDGVLQDPTDENWWVSLQNLRIYPPDPSDPTGLTPWVTPTKYHPNLWSMIGPVQCLRWLDALNTNNCQVANFSDYRQESVLSRGGSSRSVTSNIVSITPVPSGVDPFFSTKRWVIVQVTTATPHGLFDGIASVAVYGSGTAIISDGETCTFDGFSPIGTKVTSPTTFLMQFQQNNNPPYNRTMTNSIGAGGTVSADIGTTMPIQDIVEVCNQVNNGAGCDLWWNTSPVATDACDTLVAQYLAANLSPHHKCYVEYANECWNFGFRAYYWARTLGYRTNPASGDDIDYTIGYVNTFKDKHAIYLAAFKAAGRPATDVVRVAGAQGGYAGGSTSPICAQIQAQYGTGASTAIDLLATATYFDNTLSGNPTSFPDYDVMTTGQSIDLYELNLRYGSLFNECVTQHQQVLAAAGMGSVPIGNYEGGMDLPMPGGSEKDGFARAAAILRHPRIYHLQLAYFQALQQLGCVVSNIYFLGGYMATVNGQDTGWCNWIGWNQQPGTGDPVADAINISNPFAANQVKSETGGAINYWASLVTEPSPPPVPPTPKKLSRTGRNGQIRTTGYPRGLFRPTR